MPVHSPKEIESIPYIKSLLGISAAPMELLKDFKGKIKSATKDQYSAIRVFGDGLKAGHSQILAFTFAYFERLLAPGAPDFIYKALIESLPIEGRTESLLTTCLFPKMGEAIMIPTNIGRCFTVIKRERNEGETLCKSSADHDDILGKLSTLVAASGIAEDPNLKSIAVKGRNLSTSAWRAIVIGMSCSIVVINQEEEEEKKSKKPIKEKTTLRGDINVLSGPISILVTEDYSAILYSHEEAIKYADTKEVMDKLMHGKCQSEFKKCQDECERMGAAMYEKEKSYAAEIQVAREEQAKREAEKMKIDDTTADYIKELLISLSPFFYSFAQLASQQALFFPQKLFNGLKEIGARVEKIKELNIGPSPKEKISKPSIETIDEISKIKQEDLEKLSEKLEESKAHHLTTQCIECDKFVLVQIIPFDCGCLICYECRLKKMKEVVFKKGKLDEVQCKLHKIGIEYQYLKIVDKQLAKKLVALFDILPPAPGPSVKIDCCICDSAISISMAKQAEGCADVTCVVCIMRMMRESIEQRAKKVRCRCGREYPVSILREADATLFEQYGEAMARLTQAHS